MMGRYAQDNWNNPAYNAGTGATIVPGIGQRWAQRSKSMVGRWTATISNTFVNTVASGIQTTVSVSTWWY